MRRFGCLSLCTLLLAGCGAPEEDITISGTVSYPEYSSGKIEIMLIEDSSRDCGLSGCSMHTPGDTVGRIQLDAPGTFTIGASVQGSTVNLLAYALGDATVVWECEAGAYQSLSVADHRDVTLNLVVGSCPALE